MKITRALIQKPINEKEYKIWGAPQKLDKNLIFKLLYFEFGILPDSFLI